MSTTVEDPTRVHHFNQFSSQMTFPCPSPTSPTLPNHVSRLGSGSENSHSMWGGSSQASESFFTSRLRRVSTLSKTNKGKQPVYGDDPSTTPAPDSTPSPRSLEMHASARHSSSPSMDSHLSISDSLGIRKRRTSLLVAASDALGFKFGRRKNQIRPPPMPAFLPNVIEISRSQRDEDVEERDRLRDMAAQSIGIPVAMHPDGRSPHNSANEEEQEEEKEDTGSYVLSIQEADNCHTRHEALLGLASKSLPGSTVSIQVPSSARSNRLRAGSLMMHSRSNSMTLVPVPSFPTTVSALAQCNQMEMMLFKFYPPSSLRIFALHKNWRSRFMVLSSSTALVRGHSSIPTSYLHLFKTSDAEEREIERLEVNEDSVVFVAEEDVAGRKHVVKVAGVDVGALKKELNHEEGGRTMWFLHIQDHTEAQKWITAIKTAILGQRTMRAGLGFSSAAFGGIEPRGDMDVMLSMRAQGLINPPTANSPRLVQNGRGPAVLQQDRSYASSVSSHLSQATVSKSTSSSGTASVIKGLFTGSTRPRPSSRADQEYESSQDESFGSTGNPHLSLTNDWPSASQPSTPTTILSYDAMASTLPDRLAQKIIPDRASLWASSESFVPIVTRNHRALSLKTVSLQPPPRKRWTSLGPADQEAAMLVNSDINSVQENDESAQTDLVSLSHFRFGSPVQRRRAGSTSTTTSADIATDRSSIGTKRSSRRWSRHSVLPRRLSPPSGPPPSTPSILSETLSSPRLIDRTSSETSSRYSTISRQSVISNLPAFSKRTSGSSFLSTSNTNTSSRPPSSHGHRSSIPPPRPAPTSAIPPPPESKEQSPRFDQPVSPKSPSFRESVTQRVAKLSIASLKSSQVVAPSHSEETEYISPLHHRASSVGDKTPTSTALPFSPFPPPVRPLPPTPTMPQNDTSNTASARRTSLKQRLRILSTPPQPQPPRPPSPLTQHVTGNSSPTSSTATAASPTAHSPIAEKIVQYDDEFSLLQVATPIISHVPPPSRVLPPFPEPYPEVGLTPLLPPPRRGSRQVSIIEVDLPETSTKESKKPIIEEPGLMSLSRPGSVISLGILSV